MAWGCESRWYVYVEQWLLSVQNLWACELVNIKDDLGPVAAMKVMVKIWLQPCCSSIVELPWDGRIPGGGWHNRTCEIKSSVSAISLFIFNCCLWWLMVAVVTGGGMVDLDLYEMVWWCDDGSWDGSLFCDDALPLASDDQTDDHKNDWTWPITLSTSFIPLCTSLLSSALSRILMMTINIH